MPEPDLPPGPGEPDRSPGAGSRPREIPDTRAGRQALLGRALQGASLMAFVLAVGGLALPGQAARHSAGGAVAVLVLTPLARALWLAARWARKGDWRFAAAALTVVAIAAGGGGLAAWV